MPGSVVDVDPASALTVDDFARAARAEIDPAVYAYVDGGAGAETTVAANVDAYGELWLRPRALATACVSASLETTILGQELSMPILLAPTSPQRLLHAEAELATARAAVDAGTISIVSADSHYTFPEVAAAARGRCWFQLYAYRSRDDVAATAELAEAAGSCALVVTVDATHSPRRIRAHRAGFKVSPDVDFGTLRTLGILSGDVPAGARLERLGLTWDDLVWIRDRTTLPVLVKGVLHPSDARRCLECGVDGIVVSNHGGRQLDGVVPTVVALESVARAVRGECAVLVDGGIRSGVSVVKALALGADAVCIGRPYLWALAVAGESGVARLLEILRLELEDALLQLGLAGVSDVSRDCLYGDDVALRASRLPREGIPA